MQYVPQTEEIKVASPPYPPNDTMNFETPHQHQIPPPGQLPGYAPPPPSIPVYTQPITVIQPLEGFLGHNPQAIKCPSCQQQVITIVQYEPGAATWLIALFICFFAGFLGCCLIPFCIPQCQDAVHTCPSCHIQLGRRSPF